MEPVIAGTSQIDELSSLFQQRLQKSGVTNSNILATGANYTVKINGQKFVDTYIVNLPVRKHDQSVRPGRMRLSGRTPVKVRLQPVVVVRYLDGNNSENFRGSSSQAQLLNQQPSRQNVNAMTESLPHD